MKKLLLLMIFPFILTVSNSQNIVIDGSFENYIHLPAHYSTPIYDVPNNTFDHLTNCLCSRTNNSYGIYPAGENVYYDCVGWFNPSYADSLSGTKSTPDYFNKDVDSTANNGKARWVDVPVNWANTIDADDDPLIPAFYTPAFEGKGYVGVIINRSKDFIINNEYGSFTAYTEYVAQKLDQIDPANKLYEAHKYEISFRVARGDMPHSHYESNERLLPSTGHSLKRISMFLWDEPLTELYRNDAGYIPSRVQKDHFMVNEHNHPSGYLIDTNWTLVSEEFIAPDTLNYIYLGSFDLDMIRGSSFLPDSLVTPDEDPNDNISDDHQRMHYYIDSVRIVDLGKVDTCDCGDFTKDVKFVPKKFKRRWLPLNLQEEDDNNPCCTVVHLKVEGQEENCRIAEVKYKEENDTEWTYIKVTDLNKIMLEDGVYVPIDTICYDPATEDGEDYRYEFQYRTFGSSIYYCIEFYDHTVRCYSSPCGWIDTSSDDPYDSEKKAVRLEKEYNGRNAENQCCYTLKLFNHSDRHIYVDGIEITFENGDFTNSTDNGLDYLGSYVNFDKEYNEWEIEEGIFRSGDTLELGEICVDEGASTTVSLDFLLGTSESFKDKCRITKLTTHISCDDCCPDPDIDYEVKKYSTKCCIEINSFDDGGCGEYVEYYKIKNSTEQAITLPYELCETNSDLVFLAKIYDENDSLICVKNYDFNSTISSCSCCDDMIIDVVQDDQHSGQGCRYLIDNIVSADDCEFDTTNTVIEYGTTDGTNYLPLGQFNFSNFDSWDYILNPCEKDTIKFKIIKNGDLICEKDIILECQDCEDLDFFQEDLPPPDPEDSTVSQPVGCCLNIIFGNVPSGDCNYFGLYVFNPEKLPSKIDVTDNGIYDLGNGYDTATVCRNNSYHDPYNALRVHVTFGLYNSEGELICSFEASKSCGTGGAANPAKESNNYLDLNLEKIIVTSDDFEIKINKTENLSYKLYDLSGKILIEREYSDYNKDNLYIDTGNLKNGTYSVMIETDTERYVRIFQIVK